MQILRVRFGQISNLIDHYDRALSPSITCCVILGRFIVSTRHVSIWRVFVYLKMWAIVKCLSWKNQINHCLFWRSIFDTYVWIEYCFWSNIISFMLVFSHISGHDCIYFKIIQKKNDVIAIVVHSWAKIWREIFPVLRLKDKVLPYYFLPIHDKLSYL